jgi:predicted transcriptional regulator of viral defense system
LLFSTNCAARFIATPIGSGSLTLQLFSILRVSGVPRTYLSRLVRRGQFEKIAPGLNTLPALSPTEHASLVEASYQVPKGIICLLSALQFHSLTTRSPRGVWMAVGHKAWAGKIPSPSIRSVHMSGPALQFRASEHHVTGQVIRVSTPAKTVADGFKFRY